MTKTTPNPHPSSNSGTLIYLIDAWRRRWLPEVVEVAEEADNVGDLVLVQPDGLQLGVAVESAPLNVPTKINASMGIQQEIRES